MIEEYRAWLESEMKLLANAAHHAYAFGQANMAQRAIERLDAALGGKVVLALSPEESAAILAALPESDPQLAAVRARLAAGAAARGS